MPAFGPARSRHAAVLVALLLVAAPAAAAPESARGTPHRRAEAVEAVGFTVDDLDRSLAFFTGVLAFEVVSEREEAGEAWEAESGVFGSRARIARLRLGDEILELTDFLTPRGAPFPWDTRANDHWFQHVAIVVSDLGAAYARLREAGVEHASTGPQCLPESIPAAAGICAFYFRDPDGHFLELIQFPPGKGDPRWQRGDAGAPLFLGIDHTAVVVADTERSLAFYRDRLGLNVAGGSENSGTEQEHLNNVEGAHLRITTLRAAKGPGIELLEYLSPTDGRSLEAPPRAQDLAYWQTRLRMAAPPPARGPDHAGPPRTTAGAAPLSLVRDPDGHVLRFTTGSR